MKACEALPDSADKRALLAAIRQPPTELAKDNSNSNNTNGSAVKNDNSDNNRSREVVVGGNGRDINNNNSSSSSSVHKSNGEVGSINRGLSNGTNHNREGKNANTGTKGSMQGMRLVMRRQEKVKPPNVSIFAKLTIIHFYLGQGNKKERKGEEIGFKKYFDNV